LIVTGQVRSFHVDGVSAADIVPIVKANVAKETAMMTDQGGHYFTLGDHFASHESVSHKAYAARGAKALRKARMVRSLFRMPWLVKQSSPMSMVRGAH
jgi:hypothetical protein